MERAVLCPQCGAPLTPHHFARSIVCSFCGVTVRLEESSVSAAKFHEAFRIWNSPESYHISSWVSVGDSHWALGKCIAHGDIADVYIAQRARWPTELALVKLLRNRQDAELFDNEWTALQALQQSEARGTDIFTMLLPQPILHAKTTGGSLAGQSVSIFRWESGFHYNFDEVLQAYPRGIPARASIWVWRRILEILSFIHASGMAHGAIVPSNLLVQKNEHGVRLVGYSRAGRLDSKLRTPSDKYKSFYPQPTQSWTTLSSPLDVVMSARCMAAILGGNPATASLPSAVPAPLADVIQRVALSKPNSATNNSAWSVREELGAIAKQVYGQSQFIPIVMPH